MPQPVQRERSITARLSMTLTAPLSHALSHILQAMQETEQFLTTGAPFSFYRGTVTPMRLTREAFWNSHTGGQI